MYPSYATYYPSAYQYGAGYVGATGNTSPMSGNVQNVPQQPMGQFQYPQSTVPYAPYPIYYPAPAAYTYQHGNNTESVPAAPTDGAGTQ